MNGLTFPDAAHALYVHLDGLALPDLQFSDRATLSTYKRLVSGATYPAALIYRETGQEIGVERLDRVTVEVLARGYDSFEVADTIREHITGEPLWVDGVGLFDSVDVDQVPHDVPYEDDELNLTTATYSLLSRPL